MAEIPLIPQKWTRTDRKAEPESSALDQVRETKFLTLVFEYIYELS